MNPRKRIWIRRHPFLSLLAIPAFCMFCSLASWLPHTMTLLTQSSRLAAATTPLTLAQAATINGQYMSIDGDDMTKVVEVEETLGLEGFNSGYRDSVMEDCFSIQRAFWHRYPTLQDLDVWVYGPMINKETKQDETGIMGRCDLQSLNAQNMPWDELDYKGAWTAYNDATFSLAVQS